MTAPFIDPETLHEGAIKACALSQRCPPLLAWLKKRCGFSSPELKRSIFGIDFDNPLGLAAGWDKNAKAPAALAALGFGFLELGTFTLWPQLGHPRPRLFRSFKGRWIVNRIGFANEGSLAAAQRLSLYQENFPSLQIPLGLSLGKMLTSPRESLLDQAAAMMEIFYPYAAFFTINISSPNTPQGFTLGEARYVKNLLAGLKQISLALTQNKRQRPVPLFVKISPIVALRDLHTLTDALLEGGVDGIIAVNSLITPQGGLSGLPLKMIALKTTARLHIKTSGKIPIIGVGGILTPGDAWERLKAGASLIQIFSGFVFGGPVFIGRCLRYIAQQMQREGFDSMEQVCGVKAKDIARERD